jgi:glycosyltransferase involved in cell wall biosynthesis
MVRVAFTLIGGKNWTGGQNYLLNLLTVLNQHQKAHLTPVLFVEQTCDVNDLDVFKSIPNIEVVQTPLLNTSRRLRSLAQAMLIGRDIALQRLFAAHKIDVVFEAAQFFGWRIGIPAIAWIPDFQHRVLPHLFSKHAWWKREIGFRCQVLAGRTIMLSSEDARDACERYYPSTKRRTRVVSFAVPPSAPISFESARAIANSYGLPEQFFFMPNQFWRHKNHFLVLEALNILRKQGKRVVIAASGKQTDPRAPDYFPAFNAKLAENELQDMFKLLGLIPYEHLSMLLQASCALLNPSLFEGWSTTVEEARTIGTPMLLSDIDVHKEQMGNEALYFDCHSAQSLADTLGKFIPLDTNQRMLHTEAAQKLSLQRVEKFACDFVALAKHCQSMATQS